MEDGVGRVSSAHCFFANPIIRLDAAGFVSHIVCMF